MGARAAAAAAAVSRCRAPLHPSPAFNCVSVLAPQTKPPPTADARHPTPPPALAPRRAAPAADPPPHPRHDGLLRIRLHLEQHAVLLVAEPVVIRGDELVHLEPRAPHHLGGLLLKQLLHAGQVLGRPKVPVPRPLAARALDRVARAVRDLWRGLGVVGAAERDDAALPVALFPDELVDLVVQVPDPAGFGFGFFWGGRSAACAGAQGTARDGERATAARARKAFVPFRGLRAPRTCARRGPRSGSP